jgi:hypothetical protein
MHRYLTLLLLALCLTACVTGASPESKIGLKAPLADNYTPRTREQVPLALRKHVTPPEVTALPKVRPSPRGECRIGDRVTVHRPDNGPVLQHDVVIVHETDDAVAWMNIKKDGRVIPEGDFTIKAYQMLRNVELGRDTEHAMRRYEGGGTITFTVYYAEDVPDQIFYLNRWDVCQGSTPTKKFIHDGQPAFSFELPIADGGAHPLFRRTSLLNRRDAVLLCETVNGPPVYTAELPIGPARGQRNTRCSLPGQKPGTTRISEFAQDLGTTWVMYLFTMKER